MRFFLFIITALVAASYVTGTAGCANIVPPQGGPRDSLPPRLLRVVPADSTVNFKGNRIEFEFDEFIDLKELTKNTLFTPTFETNPEIRVRLRTMTMVLEDTLLPNTTYKFNFGNAITDINENNPLPNFTYIFSTGPALDSLTLTGNVLLAETGVADSTLIVLLHKNLADSAIKTIRAPYFARLDAYGNFKFNNLPPGRYGIYALPETGGRLYQSKTQTFAFADTPVIVAAGRSPRVQLYAFKEEQTAIGVNLITPITASRPKGDNRLRITTNAGGTPLELGKNFVLSFETRLRRVDSAGIHLTDSTYKRVPYVFRIDSARRNITLGTTLTPGNQYNVILDKNFAEDSAGRHLLKTDTLSFTTKKQSDYGSVRIRIKGVDTAVAVVLQLVQNNTVTVGVPVINGFVTAELLPPGEYSLRMLYDRNNNGTWDAGRFFEGKSQPERVQPLDKKINLKAGASSEIEITVPPLQ